METIRMYLENMFINYPNTPEVCKAKNELKQMMEDKYQELKSEGKTENEAVGIVISEFGNIEELADDLGIRGVVTAEENSNTRMVGIDEVKAFLSARAKTAFMMSLGIVFCIMSVCAPIFTDAYSRYEDDFGSTMVNLMENVGAAVMIVIIAVGVGLIVFSNIFMNKWDYLKKENCRIDFGTVTFIKDRREGKRTEHVLLIIIGIIFCIISCVPVIVLDSIAGIFPFWAEISPIFLFLFISVGVLMIVYTSVCWDSYGMLLKYCTEGTMGERYAHEKKNEEVVYENKTVEVLMSLLWPTATCVYLCWSFLTWDWYITWIVWVAAAFIQMIMKAIFGSRR